MSNVDTTDGAIACVLEPDVSLRVEGAVAELGIVHLVADDRISDEVVVLAIDRRGAIELTNQLVALLNDGDRLRDWEDGL